MEVFTKKKQNSRNGEKDLEEKQCCQTQANAQSNTVREQKQRKTTEKEEKLKIKNEQ